MTKSMPRLARILIAAAGLTALAGGVQAAAATASPKAAAPAAKHAAATPAASHGPAAAIHQFIDDFNKGDAAGAKASHAADVSIIDEFAPHAWRGTDAFDAWSSDLEKYSNANGQTNEKVTIGATLRSVVDGDTAYVVTRATYTYKQHGRAMVEPAEMTFALKNGADGWKIASWAWDGTTPHAAAPPAPKAPAAAPAAVPAPKP